jgi:riboflavin synthase
VVHVPTLAPVRAPAACASTRAQIARCRARAALAERAARPEPAALRRVAAVRPAPPVDKLPDESTLVNLPSSGYTPGEMFTGIVEATGLVRVRERRGPGARLLVSTTLDPLVLGESISVQGACLTVETIVSAGFEADASAETLDRTTLGALAHEGRVNLERSLQLGARLGGHIVSGHVDGRLRLRERETVGEARRLVFAVEDASLARFIAPKGSVCIDGVSLTVNHVDGDSFDVVIIPHTLEVTTLGALEVGDRSNLEVDMLARYVARLLGDSKDAAKSRDDILLAKLKAAGFA